MLPSLRREFRPEIEIDRREMGRAHTLRFNVLTYVVEENYDKAIDELNGFLKKDFEYPKFKERVERFIQHAVDLVNAIRAKRKFPGAQLLTMSKQHELNEKFAAHFSELQYVLKKVERIHDDVKLEDVRSTVWVVKALSTAATVIAITAFLLDIRNGLLHTTMFVMDDIFHHVTVWVFKQF